ncbi:sugar transferase [Candidatus Borkfalkia ceftriaxoniphila]|jgi:general glycosylation pathway protein|uniref:Sugar transferase n=1 Tax=Candidatus Borkfalkia ceftriaxoniphila TaxID=2508949 RepID=A0A4Q2KCC5_9FIRM|nr:sugar transferase [Candidatus Borkfalkia ceftriaxoniphila]RXZ61649.1 sugar transferase [Candidatus Borkfalkia ceftriaxoniphila]
MKMYLYVKYAFSYVIAAVLAVLTAPVIAVTAIAIKLEDGGKVFFSQERTGKGMKRFKVYKFRTMTSTNVAFDKDNPVVSGNSMHVTRVGRIIRKFKIDELPQIYNVLKGDMCFIAPRPLLPSYEKDYRDWEKVKFYVKPGLTGLGQVNGNGYLSTEERNYYDVYYVMHASLWLDIKIFCKTVFVVLFGEEKFINHVPLNEYCKVRNQAKALWASKHYVRRVFSPNFAA